MSNDSSTQEAAATARETAAAALEAEDVRCARAAQAQNDELSRRCAKKANLLSCRCSGCESDGKLPVLASAADAVLLNTAYDGSGGALSSGTDPRWEVGLGTHAGGAASVTSWIPAFVFHNPAWVTSPFGNANWISFFKDSAQGDRNVDLYYRYRFNLGSSVDPAAFAVDMTFYADNRVWEIFVNGVAQSTRPNGTGVLPQFPGTPATEYQTRGFDKGQGVRIRLDNGWRRCDNELVVQVMSGPPYTGFLAQNTVEVNPDETGCEQRCDCRPAAFPELRPSITVRWGDAKCDCLETDDVEVLCVTVCNCYSNVTFRDLAIGRIRVTDPAGKPVPTLPDGTPSVQVVPSGPICFGDIGPCVNRDRPSCVSRELVVYTRGAVGGRYRLSFESVCFSVCHAYQTSQCFSMKLCQD